MLVAAERHLAIGCDASRSPENTKGLFALLLFMEIQSIPGSVRPRSGQGVLLLSDGPAEPTVELTPSTGICLWISEFCP